MPEQQHYESQCAEPSAKRGRLFAEAFPRLYRALRARMSRAAQGAAQRKADAMRAAFEQGATEVNTEADRLAYEAVRQQWNRGRQLSGLELAWMVGGMQRGPGGMQPTLDAHQAAFEQGAEYLQEVHLRRQHAQRELRRWLDESPAWHRDSFQQVTGRAPDGTRDDTQLSPEEWDRKIMAVLRDCQLHEGC
jgi:hypothetical protein